MPHFMAYFGLDEYIVMSLIMTQSGNSFLKIKGIFTTSTKEEIVDYLTEYFTKFLFIIKRRAKHSNDWHGTMAPSSN